MKYDVSNTILFPQIQKDKKTNIHETNLSNGMKILVLERRELPIVSTILLYKVGGIHTIAGKTGIAHFVEHLSFQKLKNYSSGKIDEITQYLGGFNNAYTCPDSTSYYYTFTTKHWTKALEFLREQMTNCQWNARTLEKEKKIVNEEWTGYQDNHLEYLDQELDSILFKEYPYSYPILGYPNDLKNITLEEAVQFYHEYYTPDHALLIIVGDIEAKNAIEQAYHYFKDVPKSSSKNKFNIPIYQQPTQQRELIIQKNVNMTYFNFSWLLPHLSSKDDIAISLLATILGQGRSSRFYRKFVLQNSMLQNIVASSNSFLYLGKFCIFGSMIPSVDTKKIKKDILQEIQKVQEELVSPYELQKAKNSYISEFITEQETNFSFAENIGDEELCYGYKNLANIFQHTNSITAQDIQKLAQKYLKQNAVLIGWLQPIEPSKTKLKCAKVKLMEQPKEPLKTTKRIIQWNINSNSQKKFHIQKYILDNGMKLFVLPNKTVPCVSTELELAPYHYPSDPQGKCGLCALFEKMLGASKQYSPEHISQIVDFLGAEFSRGLTTLSTTSLAVDLPYMLDILQGALCHPKFSNKYLARERVMLNQHLLSIKDHPEFHAINAIRKIIYKNHPLGKLFIDHPDEWNNITIEDLYNFHQQYFTPSEAILGISGDVDSDKVYEMVTQRWNNWQGNALPKQTLPILQPLPEPIVKHIPMNNSQLLIYYGYLGIRKTNPDYYKLLILEKILGSSTGLTDRITRKIREKLGLCYEISFSLTCNSDLEPGIMLAKIATSSQYKNATLEALKNEIKLIQENGVTAKELESTKNYLCSNIIYASQTNSSLASYLLMVEKYNLGFNYMYEFENIIRNISRADIQEVAQKYLNDQHSFTISVGSC